LTDPNSVRKVMNVQYDPDLKTEIEGRFIAVGKALAKAK